MEMKKIKNMTRMKEKIMEMKKMKNMMRVKEKEKDIMERGMERNVIGSTVMGVMNVRNKAMRNGIVLEFKCLCEIAKV